MRYKKRFVVFNKSPLYKDHFKNRGTLFIRHYKTPTFVHPTVEQVKGLDEIGHTWSQGDRYYKLAHKYYKDSKLWWVIAWYNKAPTESHLVLGDVIYIPLPLNKVLKYYQLYY